MSYGGLPLSSRFTICHPVVEEVYSIYSGKICVEQSEYQKTVAKSIHSMHFCLKGIRDVATADCCAQLLS